MASEIDAFLCFGQALDGGKPTTINGETGDSIESQEIEGELGKSMSISTYDIAFEQTRDWSEETKSKDGKNVDQEPHIGDVTVTKTVDSASPQLLQALWNGTLYDQVYIAQRKGGGSKGYSGDYFWEIKMESVAVINLSWSADDSGKLTEKIVLHCLDGINGFYRPQKITGELGSKVPFGDITIKRTNVKKDKDSGKIDSSQIQDVIRQLEAKYPGLKNLASSGVGHRR